jgi:hypothetical protein
MWLRLPSGGVVGHNEEGEPAFGDIMEEIVLPDVGEFAVIWRDPRQDRLCRYRGVGDISAEPQAVWSASRLTL